jgi:ABC-type phosphate/phosphonate transport system substrate-binding protein
VDSYALQLLQRHDPGFAAGVRVVGSTAASPIPPLVGSAALGDGERDRLRAALTGLHADAAGRALLADLCLLRFDAAAPQDYDATLRFAPLAEATGYPVLC